MSETQQTPAYTDAQLHALACIHCGKADGELSPAGHVHTGGHDDRLPWAVVACPEHQVDAS